MTPAALNETMHALLREVTQKVILPRYRKLAVHEITAKLVDDVVTVADNESELMLAEGLAKIADLPVVGEEAAFADESVFERLSGDCWIVDPLDGTRNFARGAAPFGILVAMASGGPRSFRRPRMRPCRARRCRSGRSGSRRSNRHAPRRPTPWR